MGRENENNHSQQQKKSMEEDIDLLALASTPMSIQQLQALSQSILVDILAERKQMREQMLEQKEEHKRRMEEFDRRNKEYDRRKEESRKEWEESKNACWKDMPTPQCMEPSPPSHSTVRPTNMQPKKAYSSFEYPTTTSSPLTLPTKAKC